MFATVICLLKTSPILRANELREFLGGAQVIVFVKVYRELVHCLCSKGPSNCGHCDDYQNFYERKSVFGFVHGVDTLMFKRVSLPGFERARFTIDRLISAISTRV